MERELVRPPDDDDPGASSQRDGISPFKPTNALPRSPKAADRSLPTENNANIEENVSASDLPLTGHFKEAVNVCMVDAFAKLMKNTEGGSTNKPKSRQRLNSLPPDPEEMTTGKRKIEMSPNKPVKRGKTDACGLLAQLEDKLQVLAKQILEQPTVKRETKVQIKFVTDCLAEFKREYEKEKSTSDWKKLPEAELKVMEMRSRIVAAKEFDDIKQIVSEKWPTGCFKNTKVNNRGRLYEEENTIYSVLLYPENIHSDSNFTSLMGKIPAVRVITDDKLKEMGFIPVRQEEATAIDGIDEHARRKIDVLDWLLVPQ